MKKADMKKADSPNTVASAESWPSSPLSAEKLRRSVEAFASPDQKDVEEPFWVDFCSSPSLGEPVVVKQKSNADSTCQEQRQDTPTEDSFETSPFQLSDDFNEAYSNGTLLPYFWNLMATKEEENDEVRLAKFYLPLDPFDPSKQHRRTHLRRRRHLIGRFANPQTETTITTDDDIVQIGHRVC